MTSKRRYEVASLLLAPRSCFADSTNPLVNLRTSLRSPLQLDNVKDRIDAIESLHRTSELTVKSGDTDLGGFLRLRLGRLGPEHEKKEEEDGDDN